MLLPLSIIEGLYIIYMFVFFKTTYSLEIGRNFSPLKLIQKYLTDSSVFHHPIVRSVKYKSQICLFGKYASVVIFIYLILRNYIKILNRLNSYVIATIFIFCFMNYNALLYLMPFFLLEIYLTREGLVGK